MIGVLWVPPLLNTVVKKPQRVSRAVNQVLQRLGLLLSLLFLFLILAGPGQFFCKGDLLQVRWCLAVLDVGLPEKLGDFSVVVSWGLNLVKNQQKMKIHYHTMGAKQ